jgi:hypothetical protein
MPGELVVERMESDSTLGNYVKFLTIDLNVKLINYKCT